jgi:hypothetical protein
MKILVDAHTKEILGASSLGTGGDEAIHCVLDAMYAKAPYTVLQRALHIHPTVAQFHCDDPGRSRTFTRANLAAGRRIGSSNPTPHHNCRKSTTIARNDHIRRIRLVASRNRTRPERSHTTKTQTGRRSRRFWIARKPETHLFSTEACSIALSWDRLRTRFNARAIGKFSIGGTVASAGMYDYAYPW